MTRRLAPPTAQHAVVGAALTLLGLAAYTASAQPPDQREGEIHTFYFETLGYTEAWVNLTPPPRAGEQISPLTLNLTVRFRGKTQTAAAGSEPLAVIVRAEANPLYNPLMVRQPLLILLADGTPAWDNAQTVRFFARGGAPCENCAANADTVEVEVAARALGRIASAQQVSGNAFGFDFELSRSQIAIVKRFAERTLGTPAA